MLEAAAKQNHAVCMERLQTNPFWAVLKCLGPKSLHNMEMETEAVVVPQICFKGSRVIGRGRKALDFIVQIPVLRNVVAIEKGDILCLPWRADSEPAAEQ